MQPLFYAFRPMLVKPKNPTKWEASAILESLFKPALWVPLCPFAPSFGLRGSSSILAALLVQAVNWITQISFDAFVVYCFGWKALAYLIIGVLHLASVEPSLPANRRASARVTWTDADVAAEPRRLASNHITRLTWLSCLVNCRHAAGPGPAPDGRPLHRRALPVHQGPGDLLVLRLLQLVRVPILTLSSALSAFFSVRPMAVLDAPVFAACCHCALRACVALACCEGSYRAPFPSPR